MEHVPLVAVKPPKYRALDPGQYEAVADPRERLEMRRKHLADLTRSEGTYDFLALAPTVGWGSATVIGLLYRGEYVYALVGLLVIAGIWFIQFRGGDLGRIRGAIIGLISCVAGWAVLAFVGQIWIGGFLRVLDYVLSLLPRSRDDYSHWNSDRVVPFPTGEDWAVAIPVAALVALSIWSCVKLYDFVGYLQAKSQLKAQIAEEEEKLGE